MKVSISYPPIRSNKGVPLLSQNRQFQYFSEPTYIYPVVAGYAATLLSQADCEVIWDDAIAEEKGYQDWLRHIERTKPDLMMIETKTPVVKEHWMAVDDVKLVSPETKVALVGDHVTVLPRESMENSKIDYVIEGGDYDFLLLNLVRYLDGKERRLESGVWYRQDGEMKSTGPFKLDHALDALPFIDRDLTKWQLYAYKNGNFKTTPGTYMMVGRDCWWRKDGGCTFCSWPTLYPSYRVMSPARALDEIGFLIDRFGIKELFDDTGTFPAGHWLEEFCSGVLKRGYHERVRFGCNARFGLLKQEDYRLMKRAGFRMLLFGLESANQATLNRLNKGITIDDIGNGCKWAREAGLEPHITIMVGYPWETREDAENTLRLAQELMVKGRAVTLQATIVIPYPGTVLYKEALENGWLRVGPKDYERFDMEEPVLTTADMSPDELVEICDNIYKIFLQPEYVLRHLTRIRSLRDMSFTARGLVKVLGHVKDFAGERAPGKKKSQEA